MESEQESSLPCHAQLVAGYQAVPGSMGLALTELIRCHVNLHNCLACIVLEPFCQTETASNNIMACSLGWGSTPIEL